MTWTAAGIFSGLVVLVGLFLATRRDGPSDLGFVSEGWIAEHRATHDREA